MAMTLISFGMMLGFLAWCIFQKGVVPESVSSLVYELEDKNRWVWSVWIAVVSILLFPRMMDRLPEMCQFLGFLFEVCMLGVAVTPIFKREKYTAHTWFGVVGGVLSQLIVSIICPWFLLCWVGFLGLLSYIGFSGMVDENEDWGGCGLFIVESMCALTLYGSLLI